LIDPKRLLADLQKLLKRLEPDVRGRCESNPEIDARLRGEYDKAKSANRTAQAYEVWREDYVTQVAVAWILGCVFVRFLEDNRLIDTAWVAGPNDRLQLARDQHTLYFQANPTHSDREYLESVFREVAKLPSIRELLDGSHNPISKLGPTGDGTHELLVFWQRVDPATGVLVHDFTDPEWSTRFLGDLYQDLSESARKRYALLQTPEFVEEFILDRTLTPAIEEFGYSKVRMLDPTCGSGHFLLGGFHRLYRLWARHEPGMNPRELAQNALDGVYGVDLNPNVVAIARFRLLIAALKVCGVHRLDSAPAFGIHLAVGDSLLHGPRVGSELDRVARLDGMDPLQHVYDTEDADELRRILGQQYHAVVGNPPYITVSDSALNAEYRKRFGSCHRQYSLAVPFMERFFHLALNPTGYVGMITANSFMKREFGKKLVEEYIPRWDLTHVIDTSRAHIPGHGTPTVIVLGRNRPPVTGTIRAVMGIRAEAKTPADPTQGQVWRAITDQVDSPGSESDYVSVTDRPRVVFHKHPWTLVGGGAGELKSLIVDHAAKQLGQLVYAIGRTTVVGEDDVWIMDRASARRLGIDGWCIGLGVGESVRDWSIGEIPRVLYLYDALGGQPALDDLSPAFNYLWPYRTTLAARSVFGKTLADLGRPWFEHLEHYRDKLRTPLSIAFAFVSTHNHFVLDRGGKVFKQSALVLKLSEGQTENDHLEILGTLNTSVGCFWMKQTFHNKGGGGIGGGLATEEWEQFYEFDSTKIRSFPVPEENALSVARDLDALAVELRGCLPSNIAEDRPPTVDVLAASKKQVKGLFECMISMQEELDWRAYQLYGLVDEELTMPNGAAPPIRLGERAFEIAMGRKMVTEEIDTTWFERHGSVPITEIPSHWPEQYRKLVDRRITVIESDRNIGLIEQPEHKRRWNMEPWEEQERRALRTWLLSHMEESRYWPSPEMISCARLADYLRSDAEFQQVAALYRGRPDFDWTALVMELVEAESVPFLAVLRYTDSGVRKRVVWERTWELQRQEDGIDAEVRADDKIPGPLKAEAAKKRKAVYLGGFPVPPKYDSKDFKKSYWSLRGKLDVPKEPFISFPFCERGVDQTPVIGWAGWGHLQRAQAIAAYYERVKNHEGWTPERRVPLLTGILELLPWLKQWHNDIHPTYHERMGDFFQQFVEDEARAMEMTLDDIRGWTPPVQSSVRGRKKRNT